MTISNINCPICFSTGTVVYPGERPGLRAKSRLALVGHGSCMARIHFTCLSTWLRRGQTTCPCCREEVQKYYPIYQGSDSQQQGGGVVLGATPCIDLDMEVRPFVQQFVEQGKYADLPAAFTRDAFRSLRSENYNLAELSILEQAFLDGIESNDLSFLDFFQKFLVDIQEEDGAFTLYVVHRWGDFAKKLLYEAIFQTIIDQQDTSAARLIPMARERRTALSRGDILRLFCKSAAIGNRVVINLLFHYFTLEIDEIGLVQRAAEEVNSVGQRALRSKLSRELWRTKIRNWCNFLSIFWIIFYIPYLLLK